MSIEIPASLRRRREAIEAGLARVVVAGDDTGRAGRALMRILRPHIVLEEEFAAPPLGLLPALARSDAAREEMRAVLPEANKMKAEYDRMLADHQKIHDAVMTLIDAAEREGKPEFLDFAQRLIDHMQLEEEVLYPASIVIGEYVRFRLEQA
jgi:Hemerythrin HHE cation binding domain